jgi:hypothetical protein
MSVVYTGKEQNIVTFVTLNQYTDQTAAVTLLVQDNPGYQNLTYYAPNSTPTDALAIYQIEFDTEENAEAFKRIYNYRSVDLGGVTAVLVISRIRNSLFS